MFEARGRPLTEEEAKAAVRGIFVFAAVVFGIFFGILIGGYYL